MVQPKSLFRYYKINSENIEALQTPYIFLYTAKKWQDDGEYDFEINIESDDSYQNFLKTNLDEGFSFSLGDPRYDEFLVNRGHLLQKHGLVHLIGSKEEYNVLLQKLFEEGTSVEGKELRKSGIRENFFRKTGICCFTADEKTLEDRFHWDVFTSGGTGFCVEYDWEVMGKYFEKTNAGIAGRYITYYESGTPKIDARRKSPIESDKEIYSIIYSLHQKLKDEKEFRLAKAYPTQIPENDPVRKQIIPKEAVVSLTLGQNISSENAATIKAAVESNLSNVQLFKIIEQFDTCFKVPM